MYAPLADGGIKISTERGNKVDAGAIGEKQSEWRNHSRALLRSQTLTLDTHLTRQTSSRDTFNYLVGVLAIKQRKLSFQAK